MTITVAWGTSTPTSITVVATSTGRLAAAEALHRRVLVVGAHPAVHELDLEVGEDLLRQVPVHLGRRRGSELLGVLDERAHHVGLEPLGDLVTDEAVELGAPVALPRA